MTKFRQTAQFSLQNWLNDHHVEQYITALDAARCVVATLVVDDSSVLHYQLLDHTGAAIGHPLSDFPAGEWSQPATSYEQAFQWGVLKKAPGLRRLSRVDEWARPLALVEKMALIDAFRLYTPPPAIIGLAYSQPLYEVDLGQRWILREVGLACAVTGADHDYEIIPLRVFHPIDEDTLLSPPLDGVRLRQPTAPIRHGDLLVVTDLADPPFAALWQVNDA